MDFFPGLILDRLVKCGKFINLNGSFLRMIDFHPDYVESGFHKYTSENSDDVIEEFRTKLLEMYKSRLTEDEQALVDRYESMAANG